ncbi:hypothetical protein MJL81_32205, partial [Salmonella enterica subsp. enterica serovar Anatum]|nr:hypothetical protein [Salmonella enterica subsp. enterica serovar Anatum]
LVFEVHKDDLDAVAKRIHQLMENCTRIDVPLLVEVGSGENWDILRARVQAAALRAAEQTEIQWSAL